MQLILGACALAVVASSVVAAEAKDTRVYEMRIYYAAPGKLDGLNARFRNHTMKLFEKHGMENIGYWVPIENSENRLIYVLAYPSRAARDKSWKEFGGDPDWKTVVKTSEANGRLVTKVTSYFMEATDYSPAIKPVKAAAQRVFELREYTASTNHLAALDARFRDHTLKLFSKHGMEHFGYWHLLPGQKDADQKLIYILAHQSRESAEASFARFRSDPDWIKAREDSEQRAGGSLTVKDGVKSTFMRPTDYSPTQ